MPKKYKSLLNYYIDKDFNPVPINISSKERYKEHKKKRLNLLVNHLNIPEQTFNNVQVIEFGSNSGENSIVLAELNSKLTLVEPNPKMIKHIIKNYTRFDLSKRLHKVENNTIENFNLNLKYDVIIAEGFLNTLKNRNKYFKKLMELGSENSLIIINYDDKFGGFFEILKSCILKKYCNLNNIDINKKESLNIAKKFFLKEFLNLSTSRTFEAWWNDQLINPYATKLWSLKEILNFSYKNKYIFYSSSPSWDNTYQYSWYKDLKLKNSKTKSSIMRNWQKSFLYIFTGIKEFNNEKNEINEKILDDLEESLVSLVKFLNFKKDNNAFVNKHKFKKPKKLLNFLKKSSLKKANLLAEELNEIINLLNSNNSQNLFIFYKKTLMLQKTWGTLLHYVCLKKNN